MLSRSSSGFAVQRAQHPVHANLCCRQAVGIGRAAGATSQLQASRSPLDAVADQIPDPIIRAAVREPIAFLGGMFAGAFQLSPTQEPLRSWIQQTGGMDADPAPPDNSRNGTGTY